MTSDVPDASSSGLAKCRTPMLRFDLLSGLLPIVWISATCPQLMDDPDPISLFSRLQCPDDRNPLSTQNPGSRYTDSLDLRHVSPQTDGSDPSRDFSMEIPDLLSSRLPISSNVPISRCLRDSPLRTSAQISEMDDHATRVLPQTTTAILSLFQDLKCPVSRPQDLRYPECRYPDAQMLFGTFTSP
jgi:hypothetical protein